MVLLNDGFGGALSALRYLIWAIKYTKTLYWKRLGITEEQKDLFGRFCSNIGPSKEPFFALQPMYQLCVGVWVSVYLSPQHHSETVWMEISDL